MLRSVLASLGFVVLTLCFSASTLLSSFFTTSNRVARWHLKWWGRITCWMFGVKVHVKGFSHWPYDRGAVVLFNHTSFFDIFAMTGYLPDMRFGAKQELFKIPVFGAAMRRVGILPIDRARREKVFKLYEQSTERLRAGEKIALAPEGGRTATPQEIRAFKSGPFVFALQAEVPLVPVVIWGAYDIMPKGTILPNATKATSNLYLEILEPVYVSEDDREYRDVLQERVRQSMQTTLRTYFASVQ